MAVPHRPLVILLWRNLNDDLESKACISVNVSPAVPSAPIKPVKQQAHNSIIKKQRLIGGIRAIGFRSCSAVPVGKVSPRAVYYVTCVSKCCKLNTAIVSLNGVEDPLSSRFRGLCLTDH